mmetsp:Transcript_70876/g.217223  ORF Transcript_70876/g.217223 Transcript_70876/m.217223 type:complete len:234 (-) Transcript_70876:563-1264(-)
MKAKLSDVSLTVDQGGLVAVVGPRRGGKSTLIKLLGQVIDPTAGEIFIPSYLRVLHVGATPVMLEGSAWTNLTIGSRNYWSDPEFEADRVMRICERMGFNTRFMRMLRDTRADFLAGTEPWCDGGWVKALSIGDKMLVHLARALVYNPEVLVLNRPTSQLPVGGDELVFELLREFVSNRGVQLPARAAPRRRSRTAFVSFARPSGLKFADVVWVVQDGTVVERGKEDVDHFHV